MVLKTTLVGLAVAATLMAGAAQATVLQIVGGDAASYIPGDPTGPGSSTNQALGPLGLGSIINGYRSLGGYDHANINIASDAKVTFTYFGSEATFINRFASLGGSLSNDLNPGGSNNYFKASGIGSFVKDMMAGLATFQFETKKGVGGVTTTIANGANTNPNVSFFASIVGDEFAKSGNSVWLFFDDGGAGPNDNHDDLVIRMDVAPVPLPAAGGLLMLGMGALAAFKRRRTAA